MTTRSPCPFATCEDSELRVIAEWDRSVTTILRPEDD